MTRLEVRCCCQPKKLLGWIRVPDVYARAYTFLLAHKNDYRAGAFPRDDVHITLPVATIRTPDGEHRALKAEGVTIETLRRITGFEENRDDCLGDHHERN